MRAGGGVGELVFGLVLSLVVGAIAGGIAVGVVLLGYHFGLLT